MSDFILSDEQVDIVEAALDPKVTLLKVEAVAGAAKSTTLHQVTKAMPDTSRNLYLAYNKAIEVEAKAKFANNTVCKTTAAFAFAEVVTRGVAMPGIKKGRRTLNPNHCWRDIIGLTYRQYDQKLTVIDAMTKFFASDAMSITQFFTDNPNPTYTEMVQAVTKRNIKAMADKEMACSFGFSLKYYHLMLARGVVKIPTPYDLLMIDEFQDSQPVVLEIFKLLPAHTKIAVGDSYQSINGSFLHTTDAFGALEEYGTTRHLTKSFRCNTAIAARVEKYGQTNFEPTFKFKGTTYENVTDTSVGFLSKTNASLIGKMIELSGRHIVYKNIRDPKLIFKLLLTLVHLKPGCEIHDTSLKFLLDDMEIFYSSASLQHRYTNLLAYIMAEHPDDTALRGSIALLSKHGGKVIRETYNEAVTYYKNKNLQASIWLTTGHSSKGLTFGTVEISNDLNQAVLKVLDIPKSERSFEEREILMIGYVVATRCRHRLINCNYL